MTKANWNNVVYTGKDGRVYLERVVYGDKELAQKVADKLNAECNTTKYFVDED